MKKLSTLMIVAAMAVFTACGNNNETNDAAGDEATTSSTSAPAETDAAEGTMNEEAMPADAGTTTDSAATTSAPAN